jgi:hypothetical protein
MYAKRQPTVLDCGELSEFTPKNIGAFTCRGATPLALALAVAVAVAVAVTVTENCSLKTDHYP